MEKEGISAAAWLVFERAVGDYHETDSVDAAERNPYSAEDTLRHLLYRKCWIDSVQWHLEDIIRAPGIDPVEALRIKRRIDASNQARTDTVEYIDAYYYERLRGVSLQPGATANTETPAWALDRYSILALKIHHMREEALRADASAEHRQKCQAKLDVLLTQKADLGTAIDQLLDDLAAGRKQMKVYKQMKMYNDPALNPVLYGGVKG